MSVDDDRSSDVGGEMPKVRELRKMSDVVGWEISEEGAGRVALSQQFRYPTIGHGYTPNRKYSRTIPKMELF